jgi:hypothetical protein
MVACYMHAAAAGLGARVPCQRVASRPTDAGLLLQQGGASKPAGHWAATRQSRRRGQQQSSKTAASKRAPLHPLSLHPTPPTLSTPLAHPSCCSPMSPCCHTMSSPSAWPSPTSPRQAAAHAAAERMPHVHELQTAGGRESRCRYPLAPSTDRRPAGGGHLAAASARAAAAWWCRTCCVMQRPQPCSSARLLPRGPAARGASIRLLS